MMPATTLERVVEEAKSLTPQEQQQLREMLDDWLPKTPTASEIAAMTEKEKEQLLLQRMLDKGLISQLPTRDAKDDKYVRHAPIVVQGEPVSETIIRERR